MTTMNGYHPDARQNLQAPAPGPYGHAITQQNYASQFHKPSEAQLLASSRLMESSNGDNWTARRLAKVSRPRPVTMHGSDMSGFNFYTPGQEIYSPWETAATMVPPAMYGYAATSPLNGASYEQLGSVDNRQSAMHIADAYQKLTGSSTTNVGYPANSESGLGLGKIYGEPNEPGALSNNSNPMGMQTEFAGQDSPYNTKRLSDSSFTTSTPDGFSDMASCESFIGSATETQPFATACPPTSIGTSLLSSAITHIAAPYVQTPNQSQLQRAHSRGKASPTSKQSIRSTPYSAEARNKRWSTGSYAPTARRHSPYALYPTPEGHVQYQQAYMQAATNSLYPLNATQYQNQQYPPSAANIPALSRPSMVLPSNDYTSQPTTNPPSFRTLQSNAAPMATHSSCSSQNTCPDLFAALSSPPSSPPPEDMSPSDPSMVPYEQELRFADDLYTPRWIRGHGKEREGWCGICKPGKWLVLKTSAFWYDKAFMHGISAPTGRRFEEPAEVRRMREGEGWEGNCGGCGEWVSLTSTKKKGTTWFRHAYRCHTHAKVKDSPKKRRNSAEKVVGAARVSKPQKQGHQSVTGALATGWRGDQFPTNMNMI